MNYSAAVARGRELARSAARSSLKGSAAMNDTAKPMQEPAKKHGDKIDPNDPTDGEMAQKQRDKMQKQEKAEGDRREP